MAGSATKEHGAPKKTAPSPKADENSVTMGPTGRPYHGFATPPKLDGHGPARIIALCNQKGGVGKTTTTINLAAALAQYGRKVLAVDFDPQGALSAGLGIPTHDVPTIYDLLLDTKRDPREVIVPTAVEGLDVLPANIDLSAAEVHLVNEVARETILARVLRKVAAEYDVILIDCQPSLGLLTVNALTASHGVRHPARVRVLRPARRRAAHRDDRQGARPPQPLDRRSTGCSRRCTTRARCTRARCSSVWSRRSATTCSRPSSVAR